MKRYLVHMFTEAWAFIEIMSLLPLQQVWFCIVILVLNFLTIATINTPYSGDNTNNSIPNTSKKNQPKNKLLNLMQKLILKIKCLSDRTKC